MTSEETVPEDLCGLQDSHWSLLKSRLLPGLRGSYWPGLAFPVQPLPSLFCLLLVLSL